MDVSNLNEHGLELDRGWPLDAYCVCPPARLTGLSSVLVLNLDKSRVFRPHAKQFSEVSRHGDSSTATGWLDHMSLFLRVVQRAITSGYKRYAVAMKSRRENAGEQREAHAWSRARDMDAEQLEDVLAAQMGAEFGQPPGADVETDESGPLVEVYMECVVRQPDGRAARQPTRHELRHTDDVTALLMAIDDDVTDYRWWAVGYSEVVDFNKALGDVMRESAADAADAADTRNVKKAKNLTTPRPHQMYANVTSVDELEWMRNLYIGDIAGERRMADVGGVDMYAALAPGVLADGDVSLAATHLWGTANADMATSCGAYGAQATASSYRVGDGLVWPAPRLVYRLKPTMAAPEQMLRRYLPDYFADVLRRHTNSAAVPPPPPRAAAGLFGSDDEDEVVGSDDSVEFDAGDPVGSALRAAARRRHAPRLHYIVPSVYTGGKLVAGHDPYAQASCGAESGRDERFSDTDYGDVGHKTQPVLDAIAADYRSDIGRIGLAAAAARARPRYLAAQHAAAREYASRCRDEYCRGSDPFRAVLRAVNEQDLYAQGDRAYVNAAVDPRLDGYGNSMARILYAFQSYENVAGDGYVLATIVQYAGWDAMRRGHDLHMNILVCGLPGSGKSYVLLLVLGKHMIPGTWERVDYASALALAVNADRNDLISFSDEFQIGNVMDTADARPSEAINKSVRTNGRIYTQRNEECEVTGRRVMRTSVNECIGVVMGCTNVDVSMMSGGNQRRYYVTTHELNERSATQLAHTVAEYMRSTADTSLIGEFRRSSCMRQALHAEVNKMIEARVLSEPSLLGAQLALLVMEAQLNPLGFRLAGSSFKDRLMIMLRIAAIDDALNRLFFNEGARYYRQRISRDALVELDPLLVSRSSHFVFWFGLLSRELIAPEEPEIAAALLEMERGQLRDSSAKSAAAYAAAAGGGEVDEGGRYNLGGTAPGGGEQAGGAQPTGGMFNPAYVPFMLPGGSALVGGRAKQAIGDFCAYEIKGAMDSRTTDGHVISGTNIKNVVLRWLKQFFTGPVYFPERVGSVSDPDQFRVDESAPHQNCKVVRMHGGVLYFYRPFLEARAGLGAGGASPIETALQRTFNHEGQTRARYLYCDSSSRAPRTLVLGDPAAEALGGETPAERAAAAAWAAAHDCSRLVVPNPVYRDPAEQLAAREAFTAAHTASDGVNLAGHSLLSLGVDFDQISIDARYRALYISEAPASPADVLAAAGADNPEFDVQAATQRPQRNVGYFAGIPVLVPAGWTPPTMSAARARALDALVNRPAYAALTEQPDQLALARIAATRPGAVPAAQTPDGYNVVRWIDARLGGTQEAMDLLAEEAERAAHGAAALTLAPPPPPADHAIGLGIAYPPAEQQADAAGSGDTGALLPIDMDLRIDARFAVVYLDDDGYPGIRWHWQLLGLSPAQYKLVADLPAVERLRQLAARRTLVTLSGTRRGPSEINYDTDMARASRTNRGEWEYATAAATQLSQAELARLTARVCSDRALAASVAARPALTRSWSGMSVAIGGRSHVGGEADAGVRVRLLAAARAASPATADSDCDGGHSSGSDSGGLLGKRTRGDECGGRAPKRVRSAVEFGGSPGGSGSLNDSDTNMAC